MWQFDFSGIQEDETGSYTVTATRWNQTHTYQILIQDTTAPKITVKEGPLYFEVGTYLQTEDVISTLFDEDEKTQIAFWEGTQKKDSFFSEAVGEKTLMVCAWDSAGNETQIKIPVVLDTAPEFSGIREIYLASGYETDYLAGITANDTVDGDVSSRITLDTKELNTDVAGEYTICYQVTDSYGLTEEQSVKVCVMEQAELQTAINTHRIHRNEQTIVGALNLYDGGYYEEDDVKAILEKMTPACVQIRFDGKDGSWAHGSGFIISMDEEEIILCTNHHVVSGREKWDVYFFDGTKAEGTVIGTNKKIDIGFVRVNTADVQAETLKQLFTVHINKSYWESLENNADIDVCIRCIDNKGGIWRDRTGTMKQKLLVPGSIPELPQTDNDLWTSLQQFSGSSGSAILDEHGNLMGMIWGRAVYTHMGTLNLGVNLLDILNSYEEIVGKSLYYE